MNETKMLSFEEWKERFAFKNLPVTIGGYNHMLESWFRLARQGTIPADRAVEIPEGWPEGATAWEAGFVNGLGWLNHEPVLHIPRPQPQWAPRDWEPVIFAKPEDDTGLLGVYFKGEIHYGELYYTFNGMRCRPFSESAIGKPWSQI